MTQSRSVTIQLDAADYARLEATAHGRGVAPERLAQEYVRAGLGSQPRAADDPPLNGRSTDPAALPREAGLIALRDLAALRARLPNAGQFDVVRFIREGRDELEQRGKA